MDIMSLLLKRTEYPIFPRQNDIWLTELSNSDEESVAIITTGAMLNIIKTNKDILERFFEKYHLKAMFDLRNPYVGVGIPFFLYVFTKNVSTNIVYGIYHRSLAEKGGSSTKNFELRKDFPNEYCDYLNAIDNYLTNGTYFEDTLYYEFGTFPASMFSITCWNPKRYCKKVQKELSELGIKETVKLSSIAEIIRPRTISSNNSSLVISPTTWKYPLDYLMLNYGRITNAPLQKGDIILYNSNNIFLMYETPPIELHANPNLIIIRLKSPEFCSEYLYYYLSGKVGNELLNSVEYMAVHRIREKELCDLPIEIQKYKNEFYQKKFFEENFTYSYLREHPITTQRKLVFISYCTKNQDHADHVKRILTENDVDCWMAPQSIPAGSNYGAEIPDAIEKCQALVLLLSKESQESTWVSKEVKLALNRNRIVIPFQIDNLTINSEFNFLLIDCQRVIAHNREEEAINELLERIYSLT